MASRYGGITGSEQIANDFQNINTAFENVEKDVDAKAGIVTDHTSNADIHVTADKKAEWDSKAPGITKDLLDAHVTNTSIHVSGEERTKLSTIEAGAQPNQNAFSRVNGMGATTPTDEFKIVGDVGIAVTQNPNDKSIHLTVTGASTPGNHAASHLTGGTDPIPTATDTTSGLMSPADKQSLTTIKNSINRVDLTANLGPSTSVITADQASDLDLTVYGNTIVNLLGADGNFEVDSNGDGVADGWTGGGSGTRTLETTSASYGLKAQRITALAGDAAGSYRYVNKKGIAVYSGKRYVAVVDVVTDGVSVATLTVYHAGSTPTYGTKNASTSSVLYVKFTPTSDDLAEMWLYNNRPIGSTGWAQFDGANVYEVPESLYNRIGVDITESNIRDYLPHVDGRQHVQGVAITKQSKNIYSINDADFDAAAVKIIGPNAIEVSGSNYYYADDRAKRRLVPGKTYTFRAYQKSNGVSVFCSCLSYSANGTLLQELSTNATSTDGYVEKTFVVPDNAAYTITRFARTMTTKSTTIQYSDIQLELGSTATSFEPSEPQRLILPVTLASATDGSVRDQVSSVANEWVKIRRWEVDKVIDGVSLNWTFYAHLTGYKRIYSSALALAPLAAEGTNGPYIQRAIRFDGKLMTWFGSNPTAADQFLVYTNSFMYVSIANTDSGWTEALAPNTNAMKALMNGWKATANNGTAYTSWVSILTGAAPATNTEAYVAANKAPGWTGWATLDYALATPEINTIKAEGAITLHPGGNQISVETGVIQREKVTFDSATKRATLSKRSARIIGVYKGADIEPFTTYTSGSQTLPQLVNAVDSVASYYVTYITLDKYAYTANVTQTDAKYTSGLSGAVSGALRDIVRLQAQNDRQDFSDDYIEAKVDNLRVDTAAQLADIVINVKTFGAVGDGLVDDTVAIQNAINFAAQINATVYFPPGYYRLTSTLTAPNGFFAIKGAGGYNRQSTIFMDGNHTGDILTITADYFVRVEDLRFHHYGSSGKCVHFANGESHSLINCSLQNEAGNLSSMVRFVGANTRIEGNRIDNYEPLAYAIEADKILGRLNINTVIKNNNIGGAGKGMLITSDDPNGRPEGMLIYGNHFVLPSSEHITIKSSYYINIFNNVFDQCKGNAISIIPDVGTNSFITINENWFSGTGYGVYKPASDLDVNSVSICNNIFSGWQRAVYFDLSNQTDEVLTINNNQVSMCALAFAVIYAKDVTIIGNTLTLCDACLDIRDGENGGPFIVKDNHFTGTAIVSATSRSKFLMTGNTGFKTNGFASVSYAPTTTGVKYIVIPHGLSVTPSREKTIATLDNLGNDDFDITGLSIISIDDTNISVRLRVNIASSVPERVANVNIYAEL